MFCVTSICFLHPLWCSKSSVPVNHDSWIMLSLHVEASFSYFLSDGTPEFKLCVSEWMSVTCYDRPQSTWIHTPGLADTGVTNCFTAPFQSTGGNPLWMTRWPLSLTMTTTACQSQAACRRSVLFHCESPASRFRWFREQPLIFVSTHTSTVAAHIHKQLTAQCLYPCRFTRQRPRPAQKQLSTATVEDFASLRKFKSFIECVDLPIPVRLLDRHRTDCIFTTRPLTVDKWEVYATETGEFYMVRRMETIVKLANVANGSLAANPVFNLLKLLISLREFHSWSIGL